MYHFSERVSKYTHTVTQAINKWHKQKKDFLHSKEKGNIPAKVLNTNYRHSFKNSITIIIIIIIS